MVSVRLELQIIHCHLIDADNFLGFSIVWLLVLVFSFWVSINNLESHVIEKVFVIWSVNFNVENRIIFIIALLLGDLEFVFAKHLIFSLLHWKVG